VYHKAREARYRSHMARVLLVHHIVLHGGSGARTWRSGRPERVSGHLVLRSPAADQDHRRLRRRRPFFARVGWRCCRATTGSQRALPAAPGRGSPSTSSSVAASRPPCRRQIHECPITTPARLLGPVLSDVSPRQGARLLYLKPHRPPLGLRRKGAACLGPTPSMARGSGARRSPETVPANGGRACFHSPRAAAVRAKETRMTVPPSTALIPAQPDSLALRTWRRGACRAGAVPR
jgi:hypothetical protein